LSFFSNITRASGKAIFLLFILFPASVFAKNIYVPKEHKSIQGAIDASKNGDTIWVAAGKYKESLIIVKELIIFGAGAKKCTLIPPTNSKSAAIFIKNNNTIIDGLTVDRTGAFGCVLIDGGSPRLSRMVIKNSSGYGVVIRSKTSKNIPILKYNKIFNNKKNGVFVLRTAGLIENNEVYKNGGTGISCAASYAKIEKNHVHDNKGAGILIRKKVYMSKEEIGIEKRAQVIKNKVINNGDSGIVCDNASPLISKNKISSHSGKPNIMLFSSDAIIKNNELTSIGPPAIMVMSGSFPKIISNHIIGTLRFAIMGNKENALIKDNKISSAWKSRMDFIPQD